MIRYRAAWVLPIDAPPIQDGWVAIEDGRVASLGRGARSGDRAVDLGDVAILPGLVNAHTHLELSYLRDEVPPASEFIVWIRRVMAARRQRPDARSPEILNAIDRAIEEAIAFGTAVAGDISNTLVTFGPLRQSALAAVVFYELIRFNAPDPEALVEAARRELESLPSDGRTRASFAAHAPYSVAPQLFRAIRRAIDRMPAAPTSVHLAESLEELELLQVGSGPWRELLQELGVWDPEWVAPGASPVRYLDDTGFLDRRVLAVHGVQATARDLERLAARGVTLVTCPRSNVHTGAGIPPIEDFYRAGLRVAIGTDSLASAPDLSVFAEVAALHALAPTVPPRSLLDSATRQGAQALGFVDYGTIAPGQSARLIAVDVPAGTADVEEYLVSGIGREQIRWLDEAHRR